MKKILYVASEGVPFIKTGGLADVVGSLPKCIDKKYFEDETKENIESNIAEIEKKKLQYEKIFKFNFIEDIPNQKEMFKRIGVNGETWCQTNIPQPQTTEKGEND